MKQTNTFSISDCFAHKTKQHALLRFSLLITIVIAYFIFMSVKLGTKAGLLTTILTWSFFVFCTPIADAGFVLAFPVRLLVGIRMIYTQLIAFVLAFGINLYAVVVAPSLYESTMILNLFYYILSHPFPFWSIILLSVAGTVLSIYFGDEMIDVSAYAQCKKYHKHLNKHYVIAFVFLISFIIILYNYLLKRLGMHLLL